MVSVLVRQLKWNLIRMASNAPWSVKGIDPKTRETAKEFARRSGMTLGEWLNQRILEEGGSMADSQTEPHHDPIVPQRTPSQRGATESPPYMAFGASADVVSGLAHRLESIEQRSTLAVTGLDQSVRGVLARLEMAEKQQAESRIRIDDRVRKIEDDAVGPRSAEAIRTLEASFSKVANRVNDTEARISDGLDDLRREVLALGRRLEQMEREQGSAIGSLVLEQRMEQLAITLTERVEAAKAEMAAEITAAAETAGARSAGAVERIGNEVLRMAESLDRRVQAVENHASDAIEQVGGEVARAMGSLEGRMQRSDAIQAEALEKLSGEIARITEKLSERIGNAERRSAQAIDDVGEQVTRVTERLNSRYDRASSDLAERIRLSEERTARLLEDAKLRIDARLADSQRRMPDPVDHVVFASPPEPVVTPSNPFGERTLFPDPFSAPFSAPPPVIYPDAAPFGQTFAPQEFVAVEPEFAPADLDAADNFAKVQTPETEADFMVEAPADDDLMLAAPAEQDIFQPEAAPVAVEPAAFESAAVDHAPQLEAEPEPQPTAFEVTPPADPFEAPFAEHNIASPTTRQMIEQARAAARAGQPSSKAARPRESRDRPVGMGFFGRKKNNLKTALMMSVAVLALGAAVGGYMWMDGDFNGVLPSKVPGYSPPAAMPQVAVALNPQPIDPSETPAPATTVVAPIATGAAPGPNATALYNEGAQKIEAGDKAGLDPLQRAANLGLPAAQAYLGRLYEKGGVGLAKNPTEARRWYERAAQAGDRSAMHNLGLYYFEGSGGPKNTAAAAEWFRRAAMAGLTDSQYNLGRLYEEGLGVSQNPAEAYKWYILAARGGTDQQRAEARTAAARVGGLISQQARANAEKAATDLAAQAQATETLAVQAAAAPAPVPTTGDIMTAQVALIRLGYFRGLGDGQMSAPLRQAIQNFQHDKNLPTTGQLDVATAARLSTYH
jgi:localization factor PodJL